ncbi:MAG: DNA polymerase IV [bacterium]
MSTKPRVIFHVDMNSYFASVAQHFHEELRNKPIGVMGKGKGTFVIAASKEAKRYGVKTGMHKNEATKLCPNIIFFPPEFENYVFITGKILEIFNDFSPVIEPFSIDEAFLDMTNSYWIKIGMNPVDIAYRLKLELKERLGDVITCSIGIADNKLMAKFGSDMKKPNGLVYLQPDNYINVLDQFPLDDICGIGRRTLEHLQFININTFAELRNTHFSILKREFGNVEGRFLYLASRGLDYHPVDTGAFFEDPKSLSNSETFTENKSGSALRSSIYKLCEKVSLRLRIKGLFCKNISFLIKDKSFNCFSYDQKLPSYTNNTLDIFHSVIKNIPNNYVSKFVCIAATNLSRQKDQDLFDETERKDNLQKALDNINQKYGHFTVIPASINKPDGPAVDVPFSALDNDAKTGRNLAELAEKNLDKIKHKILHSS